MNAQQIRASEDFQRCADFHGHICPGLSIGYKATKAAMPEVDHAPPEFAARRMDVSIRQALQGHQIDEV